MNDVLFGVLCREGALDGEDLDLEGISLDYGWMRVLMLMEWSLPVSSSFSSSSSVHSLHTNRQTPTHLLIKDRFLRL